MTHLDRLEAESIHVIREVMAEADNPVMSYSVGKDSSVMLHLARKAFYPSPPPFPLLHVDTRWKFQAMYDFRDYMTRESGMDLLVHINPEGVEKNINPFDHGSALHTDIMKTEALKQALEHYKFDVAFGGVRRAGRGKKPCQRARILVSNIVPSMGSEKSTPRALELI
jgi:sulfate adenylyltransferase subunit 2